MADPMTSTDDLRARLLEIVATYVGKTSAIYRYIAADFAALSAPAEVGGEAMTPSPNWCGTCGKHWSDPAAMFCSDSTHKPGAQARPAADAAVGAQGEGRNETFLADLGAGWTVVRDWLSYIIVRDAGGRDVIKSLNGNDEAEFIMHIIRRLAAPAAGKGVDDAARALVEKMHTIHDDLEYKTVWYCAQHHQGPYTGPKYEAELAALEAALTRQSAAGDGKVLVRESMLRHWLRELNRARICESPAGDICDHLHASVLTVLNVAAPTDTPADGGEG